MILRRALAAAALVIAAVSSWAQPESGDVPSVFSTFPVPPKSKDLLFYIQRNKNANTIVYEANRDAEGRLVAKEPVRVQWIRHTNGGKREPISIFEDNIAYGVRLNGTTNGRPDMRFVASDRFPFTVWTNTDGQAEARMVIDGHYARLEHVEIQAVEGSWLPKVAYVDIIGTDLLTHTRVSQRYTP